MTADPAREARPMIVFLASSMHAAYHGRGARFTLPWRECPNELCQKAATYLADTDTPEGAEHDRITRLDVRSIYGARTHQGIVEIQVGGAVAHVHPEEAREFALNVLSGAEAAEQDAFLMDMFTHTIGLADQQAAAVLATFRNRRAMRGEEENDRDE